MDAGARTSLFQINRRACGGRPMTRPRRGGACCARRGGGTRRCIVIDTCSFGDSSPKMCSRHGPSSFCVYPRSFNQALLLSTRWMFGRVNRMVVIGRFGAFFGRRRLVADADTGWSSAARTDATGCMLQRSGDAGSLCSCEAARGVAARARDRALFAALDALHKRRAH